MSAPSPTPIPRLHTPRLLLREWQEGDLDAYAALAGDPEAMRYVGGTVDRAASWRQMAVIVGHWQLRGYGPWAVERAQDGELLGRIGLWNPEGWPGLEVGWTLARHAWAQGYATEAGGAAMEWAWSELGAPRLISVIHPDNEASMRVAGRLGMQRLGDELLDGKPVTIFGRERPD